MPAMTPGTAPIEIEPQTERLEVGGQEHEDHEHGDTQTDAERLEHLVHRRELTHGLDPHAAGRITGGGEHLGDLPRRPAHVLALDIRGQRQVALRHVAVDTRRAARPCSTVATSRIIRLTSGLIDSIGKVSMSSGLSIRDGRHQDLHQVVETGLPSIQ